MPQIAPPNPDSSALAARLLQQGALVAFATETVYGLGADARQDAAVAGIYAAKGRPSFNPLIVHVASIAAAQALTLWSDQADRLAQFWPGPLTLVLPLAAGHGLSPLVTAGLDSVAVRIPRGAAAQGLLAVFGGPVAAPSANPSGRLSPTTAQHVAAGLGDQVDLILDAGPAPVGLESSIVSLLDRPRLLRPGGVPRAQIEAVLGAPLAADAGAEAKAPIAPGMLASHYAPRARVRLNAAAAQAGEVMLGFGAIDGDINLSPSGDLIAAAAALFDALHRLDEIGQPIAVAPIPDTGLGQAINDRLRRAAAPR